MLDVTTWSTGVLILINCPQKVTAWLLVTLQSLLVRSVEKKWSRKEAEWNRYTYNMWALASLLISPSQPSPVHFSNVSKPSKVNPCAIYYCHLPTPWEGGLKSVLSFVLYIECCVKCLCQACQIDTQKSSGAGTPPPFIFSYLTCSPGALAGLRGTHKRAGCQSFDI